MGKVITNIVSQNSNVSRTASGSNGILNNSGTLERAQQGKTSSPTIFSGTSILENRVTTTSFLSNNQQNSITTNLSKPSISTSGEIVNLNKKVYNKNQYEKVIDTKFSQLATTPSPTSTTTQTISINEFFQYYNQLFFEIPKEGENNSHEYLIKTSSEYINFVPINEDIQALIDEINILQQTNLELNQQLVELQTSGSQTNG